VLVEIDGFLVISTRVIEFLHLQRQSGNALDAVYVLGVLGQDSLVLIDGAVGIGEVVGRVYARNILSDIGGSQIELGIHKAGIEGHGVLKVLDGLLVAGILVRRDPFIELVAGA